jgi:predicted negative regulator of RcsB-dependent stress response
MESILFCWFMYSEISQYGAIMEQMCWLIIIVLLISFAIVGWRAIH